MNHETRPRDFDDAPPTGDLTLTIARAVRVACQALGLILVVAGAFFGLQLASDLLHYVRNPGDWEQAIAGMAKALNLSELAIAVDGRRVTVDRPVALLAILAGYFVCTWVAMRLMIGGAKLMAVSLVEKSATEIASRNRQEASH